MTPDEFEERMKAIFYIPPGQKHHGDCEAAHGGADDLMCQVLRELGYGAGIDIYEHAEKWYA